MGCGELMFFQPYGEGWKRSRRILHPHIHPNAIAQYREIQETAARTFTLAVLETEPSPAILSDLIRMDFAATILKIVYGISIKTKDEKDVYISVPNKLTEMIVEAGTPGRFFVDGLDFRAFLCIA
jgi:cytochrome P450